jgi:putative chitinase
MNILNLISNKIRKIRKFKKTSESLTHEIDVTTIVVDKELEDGVSMTMNVYITQCQFKKLYPKSSFTDIVSLNSLLDKYDVNTLPRLAAFLGQCSHESLGFSVKVENLNYSANALTLTFPRHFATKREAELYARQPEKIANKVYSNRMNNGPEESGDGWRYRGVGYIQLTGKYNWELFAKYTSRPIESLRDYLLTDAGSMESALWFWQTNGCNALVDKGGYDSKLLTKRINGGYNGLEHRVSETKKALNMISCNFNRD